VSKRKVFQRMLADGTGFKVYRDYHWGEWTTEFYAHGKRHDGASYHTDTQQDARDTGEFYLTGKAERAESVQL
jgi:hypothetical protein